MVVVGAASIGVPFLPLNWNTFCPDDHANCKVCYSLGHIFCHGMCGRGQLQWCTNATPTNRGACNSNL